jgi:hypothetical protein
MEAYQKGMVLFFRTGKSVVIHDGHSRLVRFIINYKEPVLSPGDTPVSDF